MLLILLIFALVCLLQVGFLYYIAYLEVSRYFGLRMPQQDLWWRAAAWFVLKAAVYTLCVYLSWRLYGMLKGAPVTTYRLTHYNEYEAQTTYSNEKLATIASLALPMAVVLPLKWLFKRLYAAHATWTIVLGELYPAFLMSTIIIMITTQK